MAARVVEEVSAEQRSTSFSHGWPGRGRGERGGEGGGAGEGGRRGGGRARGARCEGGGGGRRRTLLGGDGLRRRHRRLLAEDGGELARQPPHQLRHLGGRRGAVRRRVAARAVGVAHNDFVRGGRVRRRLLRRRRRLGADGVHQHAEARRRERARVALEARDVRAARALHVGRARVRRRAAHHRRRRHPHRRHHLHEVAEPRHVVGREGRVADRRRHHREGGVADRGGGEAAAALPHRDVGPHHELAVAALAEEGTEVHELHLGCSRLRPQSGWTASCGSRGAAI